MNRALKRTIQTVLTGQHFVTEPAQPYCSFCDSKKKMMTTTYCACGTAICGEPQEKICPDCSWCEKDNQIFAKKLKLLTDVLFDKICKI